MWNSSAGIPSPLLALLVVILPKAQLTSHSRMSGSRWVITPLGLSGSLRSFLYSSVYSCHLLISSASVRSLPVFVLYCAYLCMKYFLLVPPIFLKRSLESSPFYCLPLFICIIHLRRLSDLSCYSLKLTLRWVHLSFFTLPFISLFSAICKPSPDNRFAFLHFFFLGMVLDTTSCYELVHNVTKFTMLWTSIQSSAGTLSTRSNPLSLLLTSTV